MSTISDKIKKPISASVIKTQLEDFVKEKKKLHSISSRRCSCHKFQENCGKCDGEASCTSIMNCYSFYADKHGEELKLIAKKIAEGYDSWKPHLSAYKRLKKKTDAGVKQFESS